jgi:hypothetical protein
MQYIIDAVCIDVCMSGARVPEDPRSANASRLLQRRQDPQENQKAHEIGRVLTIALWHTRIGAVQTFAPIITLYTTLHAIIYFVCVRECVCVYLKCCISILCNMYNIYTHYNIYIYYIICTYFILCMHVRMYIYMYLHVLMYAARCMAASRLVGVYEGRFLHGYSALRRR